MFYPRDYQIAGCNALWDYFSNGGKGHPILAMPTGTGKSLIPAMFIEKALKYYPYSRMACLSHVKEIVKQNYNALKLVWPEAPAGLCSSGLKQKNLTAPLTYGGIQTVKNMLDQLGFIEVLFIDECQLLANKDISMYQLVISALIEKNPRLKVIGLSATPYRMGLGPLTDGDIFTDIVFDLTTLQGWQWLLQEYYLTPLVTPSTENKIDLADIGKSGFDFNQNQLEQRIIDQKILVSALEESYEKAKDRKKWMIFAAGIKNVRDIAKITNSMGIKCTYVHSNTKDFKMKESQRDAALRSYKEGLFQAISLRRIGTVGFDDPSIDTIIDLAPTLSTIFHVQKYGRGTRPYFSPNFSYKELLIKENRKRAMLEGGKLDCLILDYSSNISRLGPVNDPILPTKPKKGKSKKKEPPIKICENCGAYNHTVVRICCVCDAEFLFKTKIKSEASTEEAIRIAKTNIQELEVTNWTYSIYKGKNGKTDKLQVTYFCGLRPIKIWLAFEDKGLPLYHAKEWWYKHSNDEVPETVNDAHNLIANCRKTKKLRVDLGNEWPEVLEYMF